MRGQSRMGAIRGGDLKATAVWPAGRDDHSDCESEGHIASPTMGGGVKTPGKTW